MTTSQRTNVRALRCAGIDGNNHAALVFERKGGGTLGKLHVVLAERVTLVRVEP